MKRVKFASITLLLLCFARLNPLWAQISFAPSFVFIDERSGVGNLFVSNDGDAPQEVSLSFGFGYPASDSLGNLVMNYTDSTAYQQYALNPIIRAFPRNFVIKKGEQRTVRLQIIPGKRSTDGFFFTRVKMLSRPQTPQVAQQSNESASRVSIDFEQNTAVFYHHGKVSTGLLIKQIEAIQIEKNLQLRCHIERTGNAVFLGNIQAKLKNQNGKVLTEAKKSTTAYFEVIRNIDLKLEDVPPGIYDLELSFETKRNDMIAENLVQAPLIVHQMKVDVK